MTQQETIKGLSTKEALARQKQYGYNEIDEHEESTWHRIFRRFWGPIPWMIEVAAILSAFAKRWEDLIVILVLLFVNSVVDYYQEYKALNAIRVLKQKLARTALVLRDKKWVHLPAREIVPGDVVKLSIGNIVPADVRLIGEGDYLSGRRQCLCQCHHQTR